MMYSDKLVVAVLANGKVLREHKDQVYLPFGQEYTLRFKNLNSVRALVRVTVDGQDATEGTSGLIVPAKGTVDLERFIKGGNMRTGNRFKFIERTKRIEDGPRGIGMEDGLISVEFEFEREQVKITDTVHHYDHVWHKRHYYDSYPWPTLTWSSGPIGSAGVSGSVLTSTAGLYNASDAVATGYNSVSSDKMTLTAGDVADAVKSGHLSTTMGVAQNSISGSIGSVNAFHASAAGRAEPQLSSKKAFTSRGGEQMLRSKKTSIQREVENDVGITVPGSVSEQQFTQGAWFPTDGVKHVMVLKILGEVGEVAVAAPLHVSTKQKCTTCGHVNKSHMKFCGECGTSLQLS